MNSLNYYYYKQFICQLKFELIVIRDSLKIWIVSMCRPIPTYNDCTEHVSEVANSFSHMRLLILFAIGRM